MFGLDETDIALLRELSINARRSDRDLARTLRIAPSTVSRRIFELERTGVIRGYIPILDDEKLGYDLRATVGIRISKGKLKEVEERLSRDPRAYALYDVTGEFDALLIGRFRGRRDLDQFLKHALQDPNVERTNTQVVLNTVKEEPRLPLPSRPSPRA
jgi:DNA-binding Lrp family transcriptional regulator